MSEEISPELAAIIGSGNSRLIRAAKELGSKLIQPEITIGLKLDPDLQQLFNAGARQDAIGMQTLREIQLLNTNCAKFFSAIANKYLLPSNVSSPAEPSGGTV